MQDIFQFICRFFWAICIGMSFFLFRASKEVREQAIRDRDFGLEHRKLRNKILIWTNIPWVIMGIGLLSGAVPSVWHFYRPRDLNPVVLAFLGFTVIFWLVSIWWTFKGGAEKITEHDLIAFYVLGKRKKLSPGQFKAIVIVCILGGLIGLYLSLTRDVPIPPYG
jgi:hypothetical protein